MLVKKSFLIIGPPNEIRIYRYCCKFGIMSKKIETVVLLLMDIPLDI